MEERQERKEWVELDALGNLIQKMTYGNFTYKLICLLDQILKVSCISKTLSNYEMYKSFPSSQMRRPSVRENNRWDTVEISSNYGRLRGVKPITVTPL